MPFISVSDDTATRSVTCVENKFITKYMPVLEPNAVKVYLFALYICRNGLTSYTCADLAAALEMTEDKALSYFEYLEEFELVAVVSRSPLEIKILDAENVYGTPKKYKPEKYADFTRAAQSIIKGRMISTNEFMEYFYLLEEYNFEQNALLMIISYCVNLRGDNIRFQYIKKVAKSFADDGITTAAKVDEKLSAYTSSTPVLIKLFAAAGIRKQPDVDDDKLYKKWTKELGFDDDAIVAAAKNFKVKSCDKLDEAMQALYKNRKFDVKEIEDYCKNKNSVRALTTEIAKSLGVYMSDPAPYIENYVNAWYDLGYSPETMKKLARYSFKNGKNSFQETDALIKGLYADGIVSDGSVDEYMGNRAREEKLLTEILSVCGLTRKVIDWDRNALRNWRSWNFSDEMLFCAARQSCGKANPVAYMNAVLSAWKSAGIFSPDNIPKAAPAAKTNAPATDRRELKAEIESHYSLLRQAAEDRAENALKRARADSEYAEIRRKLNDLNIELAFAELRDKNAAAAIGEKIEKLERAEKERLAALKIEKADFTPRYSCTLCNDTGYDKNGSPCVCLKKFLAERDNG